MKFLDSEIITKCAGIGCYTIDCREVLSSTNTELMSMAKNGAVDCTVLIAEHQTGGRGRFDRKFYSPQGTGAYFSILYRLGINTENPSVLTTEAAVAVALALDEFTDKDVKIKWVNDIYIDDKKVCGILTEASVNTAESKVEYAVVGIGINIISPQNGFPDDIAGKAGYVMDSNDISICNKVIGRVLYHFNNIRNCYTYADILSEYISRSWLDGKRVDVVDINTSYPATVLGTDDNMRLIVQTDEGDIKYLNSGEVSVKS